MVQQIVCCISTEGFVQSQSGHSLFIKGSDDSFIAFLIYIDDMIIASNDVRAVEGMLWNYCQILDNWEVNQSQFQWSQM